MRSPRHLFAGIGLAFVLHASDICAHDASEVAIERVTAEIVRQPADAMLYLSRATMHLEHGDWQDCLSDVERADRHSTTDLGFNLLRGRALAAGKRWQRARVALDAHLESHPHDARAWIAHARVNEALGQTEAAARDYGLAIQFMTKPEPDQLIEYADLLCRAGHDDEALVLLDHAPVLPVIVDRAIHIELRLGQYDAALRRLDALLAITTMQEPLLAKRASILAQAGRNDEAILAWKALIQRILAMPPEARASHAISKLMIQSQQALAALSNIVASHSP